MWVRSDMKLVNLEKVLKVDTPQLYIYICTSTSNKKL